MIIDKKKPYVIYLAEIIYKNIVDIKENNPGISNVDAIEGFIGTDEFENISSGKFHDAWFNYLENNHMHLKNKKNLLVTFHKLNFLHHIISYVYLYKST